MILSAIIIFSILIINSAGGQGRESWNLSFLDEASISNELLKALKTNRGLEPNQLVAKPKAKIMAPSILMSFVIVRKEESIYKYFTHFDFSAIQNQWVISFSLESNEPPPPPTPTIV